MAYQSLFGIEDQPSFGMPVAGFQNNALAGMPSAPGTGTDFLSMKGFLGGNGQAGWGGAAMGLLGGIGQGIMGAQNLGMAKQQLAFQKQAFEKNLANQTKLTNNALEDRQRARVASNAGAYQPVSDYMRDKRI